MRNNTTQILVYELAWWIFTAIVCLLVFFQFTNGFLEYPYLLQNMLFITVFLTFTRWVFLLRLSAISLSRNLMIFLIFIAIPIFLYLLTEYRSFKMYWDDGGVASVLVKRDFEVNMAFANFFRKQMLFFSIGSMLAVLVFPFRIVRAVWQKHNKGYV